MIATLGRALSNFAGRYVPDPFAIAVLLTLVTFIVAGVATEHGPAALLGFWGGRLSGDTVLPAEMGFWRLLGFGMQMCLILVTGYALASAPAVRRVIHALAEAPKTPARAIALTALVAMAAALINWGLGLIVGALLARDVGRSAARRGLPVHYPLVGAAGYAGLMVWHGGLSGTAPFKVTQAKDLQELLGRTDITPIGLDQTVFSALNLTVCLSLLVVVPLVLIRMQPRDPAERTPFAGDLDPEPPAQPPADATPAERLGHSRVLAWLAGLGALAYLYLYLSRIGLDRADLNAINLFFLALGLVLHGSPRAYADAISEAATGCAGIILQFPFYAGIMGLMAASGLMTLLAEGFAGAANETTFAPLTFLSAGLVNLFVPSGGGQWAVQGPVVVQSADALGVPISKAILAFAYGDGWTNMLQPFWALPLLAITGLRAQQLIGYTAALMCLVAPLYMLLLAVL
jgi:short-chain fatty acids transporter